ncbi:MAG: thioredoxin [Pseudomonadales bacterium]
MNVTANASAAGRVFDVSAATFQQDVLEKSLTTAVLVDFWATWCGPCKALGPILEKLAEAYGGAVVVAKVDVDREQALAQHFQIRSVPTVMLVVDGRIVGGFPGALPESEVRRFLAEHGVEPADAVEDEAVAEVPVDPAAEVARLRDAVAAEPDKAELKLDLALALLETGDPAVADEAATLIDGLPANLGADRRAVSARARIRLAQVAEQAPSREVLAKALEDDADDLAARHQLGVRLVLDGDWQAGLEMLLSLLERDRTWRDGLPRQALVDAFAVVDDDALVRACRRKMTALLF